MNDNIINVIVGNKQFLAVKFPYDKVELDLVIKVFNSIKDIVGDKVDILALPDCMNLEEISIPQLEEMRNQLDRTIQVLKARN